MLHELPIDLRVDPVTRIEDLEHIEAEWLVLWRSCPHATPFQLPQWVIPWWRNLGSIGELHSCAVWFEGRLVALAPLFAYQRTLYLIGTSNSDSLDILVDPDYEDLTMGALLSFMANDRGDWNACEFHQLPPDSLLLMASPSWLSGCQVCTHEPCPVLRLPANCPSLAAAVPPSIYRKSRYYRRRAAAEGDFSIDRVNAENMSEFTEALIRLHGEHWRSRGQSGVLSEDRIIAFHRETIPALFNAGMLRMFALRIDGDIVGMYYGFSDGRRAYAYLGGFDPKYEPIGPDTILISEAIDDAVHDCLLEFDFLRGQEPYKYKWGARDRHHYILCWQKKNR